MSQLNNSGANTPSTRIIIGTQSLTPTDSLTGQLAEIGGVWPIAFSLSQVSALNSNAHAYWKF